MKRIGVLSVEITSVVEASLRVPWKRLTALVPVVLLSVALWLLFREISQLNWTEIEQSVRAIPSSRIAASLVFLLLNYVALTGYDWLALKSIGVRLGYPKVAFASFVGFVASYNFGATLGGIPIRYRIYSTFGLSAIQILQLAAMLGITFWIGLFALAGAVFVIAPITIPAKLHLPFESVYGLGWILLAVVGAYVIATLAFRRAITIRGREISLPTPQIMLGQLAISAADFLLAAATLYALLPSGLEVGYWQFLSVFLLASVAVVLSHVPGGIGVFELVMVSLLGAQNSSELVASLLAFRVLYYFVPLVVASSCFGFFELRQVRETVQPALRQLSQASGAIAPSLIAGVVFIGGSVLLFSGATPSVDYRMQTLRNWFPLPFIELSHFVGSLIGVSMLLVAHGLYRKLDSAWWSAVTLTVVGMIVSIVKGLDFEEAILLGTVLLVLAINRRRFYRKGALIHQRYSFAWFAVLMLAIVCSVWLGLFSFKHLDYRNELWWKFSFGSDASRFMRASVGVMAVGFTFFLWRLMSSSRPPQLDQLSKQDWSSIKEIVARSERTNANLGLLGDKRFFFNDSRTSCLMYAVEKKSWVVMGDPLGPVAEHAELVWKFREACDLYDAKPVFYQVDKECLSLYLDQGLTLVKIGEEARVPLSEFSLEGQHKSLRSNRNKLSKSGCVFEVVSKESVPELLPRLREISDAWLGEKNAAEKGFSLGFFSDEYLLNFPMAVVKQEGKVIAFANLWPGFGKVELSIDLMRYESSGPHGLMDFLFTELMLWGKAEGYQWFNLGMAPLSGIESRPLAPVWNKAIAMVYRHGDHFYSFDGLRQYKSKFGPVWSSKYLASPGGLALPQILGDLVRLIGRKQNVG